MERHLSTGVSTIVALMAAHRAASGREGPAAVYSHEEVARIDAYLHDGQAQPVAPAPRRGRQSNQVARRPPSTTAPGPVT